MSCGTTASAKTDTTNGNSTANMTRTNPQWVTDTTQGLAGQIGNAASADPQSYVAGPSDLQNQQFGLAGGLGATGAANLTQAGQMAGAAQTPNTAMYGGYNPAMMNGATIAPTAMAQGATAAGGIGSYLNPYSDYVAGNTLNEMDRARQLTLNQNGQGGVLAGQYGGSRQGVLDANTNRDFLTTAGNTLGNIYSSGFSTALDASNNDANRAQAANLQNAQAQNTSNLTQAQLDQQASAANQGANNQAWQYNAGVYNAGNQFNAGQADNAANRSLAGSQILGGLGGTNLNYLANAGTTQQGLNQNLAGAPLSVLQQLSQAYGSLPLGLFSGTNTNNTNHSNTTSLGATAEAKFP